MLNCLSCANLDSNDVSSGSPSAHRHRLRSSHRSRQGKGQFQLFAFFHLDSRFSQIAEFDTPWQLIQKEDGIFRTMCLKSGSFSELEAAAKAKAERDQQ